MRGVENNILSVTIIVSVNKKNEITDLWLMTSVKKLPTLAPPHCVKNAALISVHITLVIIYSQRFGPSKHCWLIPHLSQAFHRVYFWFWNRLEPKSCLQLWCYSFQTKVKHIKETSKILKEQYNGDIPNTVELLCKLPGVGPKMAHLCMQVAWGITSGIGKNAIFYEIPHRWMVGQEFLCITKIKVIRGKNTKKTELNFGGGGSKN